MSCLITGVAGFIGSHLAERLLEEGLQVIGVDLFLHNYPKRVKEANLKNLLPNPRFKFIEGNIIGLDLKKLLSKVEVVFHQAALPGVRSSWGKDFKEYVENNILATQILLEVCKGIKLKKFIYASSSSVYGDSDKFPLKEDFLPNPVSPYGVSKLAAEHLCVLYYKNYGVPTVSLRYFTVYGPRQRPDMAFQGFFTSLLLDRGIEVYGSGAQTRDFTFISDAVEANLLAMNKGKEGEVYNIGGGSRISLIEAVGLMEEIAEKKAKVEYREPQKGDVKHTYADISKAKIELGCSPKVNIQDGLREHYRWLKGSLDIYR